MWSPHSKYKFKKQSQAEEFGSGPCFVWDSEHKVHWHLITRWRCSPPELHPCCTLAPFSFSGVRAPQQSDMCLPANRERPSQAMGPGRGVHSFGRCAGAQASPADVNSSVEPWTELKAHQTIQLTRANTPRAAPGCNQINWLYLEPKEGKSQPQQDSPLSVWCVTSHQLKLHVYYF